MTEKNNIAIEKVKKNSQVKKTIKDLRKAILKAAELAGNEYGEEGVVSYLKKQAIATPSPFLTLLGKTIHEEDEQKSEPIYQIEIVAANPKKLDS